eukprot:CAMPEP_0172435530 /NCGR_PEP_ID=MMETSP1064-20121228/71230_1 /TAXON_ID=202472 /ORGANISM="Aulacoseira subarctica , Strain CCAP 1002/5" /LENGTH=409 /DNA_ID=CAMNT_0013183857 /DNA_START=95 /DNA_END=1324 /DNA_ORIENTATION=-
MSETIVHLLALGDSFHVDENYESALQSYNDAWSAANTTKKEDCSRIQYLQFQILSHRANVNLLIGNTEDAHNDMSLATAYLPSLEITPCEKLIAYKRLGIALYQLGRHDEAKANFQLALQTSADAAHLEKKNDECLQWIDKCHEKINEHLISNPRTTAVTASSKKSSRHSIPTYQYYQNDYYVTVAILEPNVNERDLKVEYSADGKSLLVCLCKQGIDVTVICGTLFDSVIVEKSKTKITDEKVLLKLKKSTPHTWHELLSKSSPIVMSGANAKHTAETTDVIETSTVATVPQHRSNTTDAPTSETCSKPRPYASHRDWNAIERELSKKEDEEKPEGEEALNKLFKQIYGNATEDTRRAMVKSFQTSGGTVLSTNWDEVSKANYEKERQAPKGMEWKTWEGDKVSQKEA